MGIRILSRLAAAVLVSTAPFGLPGCWSYAELVTIRDGTTSPGSETPVGEVLAIVEQVAREFGLQDWKSSVGEHWNDKAGRSYSVLAAYGGGPSQETHWSRIFLSVSVQQGHHGDIRILLRDWDSRDVTPFTRALRDRLARDLGAMLPSDQIQVQRIHDTPLFLQP